MAYNVNVKVDKPNGNIKTVSIIKALLEKYPELKTDKEIMKTALIDLYSVDDDKRYYIVDGSHKIIADNIYRIFVYN